MPEYTSNTSPLHSQIYHPRRAEAWYRSNVANYAYNGYGRSCRGYCQCRSMRKVNYYQAVSPMETMKYPNVSGGPNMAVSGNGTSHVEDVDSGFWQNANLNIQNEYMNHKIIIEPLRNDSDDEASTVEALNFEINSHSFTNNLAELKPLPPFTENFAGNLINGMPVHHYNAIAQRMNEENNNNYSSFNEQNIVSSSTCNASVDSAGENGKSMYSVDDDFSVVKLEYSDIDADSVSNGKVRFSECVHPIADSATEMKTEIPTDYEISDDLYALIGTAIADTTVSTNNNNANVNHEGESQGSGDSWPEFEHWLVEQPKMTIHADGLSEFVLPTTTNPNQEYMSKVQSNDTQGSSTLQSLLTAHPYGTILHNRLQNGPMKEVPSSTNFNTDLISQSSPPANVVSTTENIMLGVNGGRFMPPYTVSNLSDDRIRSSPDLMQNFPHTTTNSPAAPKKSRSRTQKKQPAGVTLYQAEQNLGLLGKEKPVHRCQICNRGFLNKSNIKVHLRTHTGEKPFKCETCGKAFRQKAHLLKHQQIHKRIGRD